jgi:ketosteroid isomerase-like protein
MERDPKPMIAMVKGSYRYIEKGFAADQPELFDRESDPLERTNVAGDQPDLVAELSADVELFLSGENTTWGKPKEVELDEMRMHQLRALGYVIEPPRVPKEKKDEEGVAVEPTGEGS